MSRVTSLEQHITNRKAKSSSRKVLTRDAAKLGWSGHGIALADRYDKVRDFTLRVFEANLTHKKNGELVDVMASCKHTGLNQEDRARRNLDKANALAYAKRIKAKAIPTRDIGLDTPVESQEG